MEVQNTVRLHGMRVNLCTLRADEDAIRLYAKWINNEKYNHWLGHGDQEMTLLAEKEYIEKIIAEHDAAKNKLDNAKAMEQATYHLNEQALTFIEEFEDKIPKSVHLTSFTTSDAGVNVSVDATGYDDVAQLIVNLKTTSCIQNVYVASVSTQRAGTETGISEDLFKFALTCEYVAPQTEEAETAESK